MRNHTDLYLAFTAAPVLQAHILQDVEKLPNNLPPSPIPAHARHFPAVSKLLKYSPSSDAPDDYLTFEILRLLSQARPTITI